MENQFFLNAGFERYQTQDCFFNPNWDKSTDQNLNFDSALSSIVSSPAATSSPTPNPNMSNENFMMRELIGKLGTFGESSQHSSNPLVVPMMNHFVKENMQKPMSSVAEFSPDPGFVQRAAKFSCFGSKSFNDRSNQFVMSNNVELAQRSNNFMGNGVKLLPRVSSSPSLKTFGSQMVNHENKNSPLQQENERMEVANSQEESTISEQNTPNGEICVKTSPDMNSRKRKASSSKAKASNSINPTKGVEGNGEDSNAKKSKANENGGMNMEEESKENAGEEKQNKSDSKAPEPQKDYIHVRARRGQATDSHSLAERVRREKISERMKLLQDLVPGCNKVTGKALMLDEIINYVQSLQRQVEFLSMKLSSVNNTKMDLSIESLVVSKDIFQSNNCLQNSIFQLDSSAPSFYGQQPQQNQIIHNNIPNTNGTHCSVEPLDSSLCHNIGMHLPFLNGLNEGGSQYPLTFSEEDLNTIVQMGFGQTSNRNTPIHSPNFNGSNQATQMKIEL